MQETAHVYKPSGWLSVRVLFSKSERKNYKMIIYALLVTLSILLYCECKHCSSRLDEIIDITSGRKIDNGTILYKNMTFTSENYFHKKGKTYGCVCNIKTCLAKCCSEGKRIINEECREFDNEVSIIIHKGTEISNVDQNNFYLIKSGMCESDVISLTDKEYYIQENGHIHTSFANFTNRTMYCIDGNENSDLIMYACYREEMETVEDMVAIHIGMLKHIYNSFVSSKIFSNISNFLDLIYIYIYLLLNINFAQN